MVDTTLVCFAVKEEAKFFRPSAETISNVQVLLTGMGRKNAERAIQEGLKSKPGLVLSTGFAGGLRPGLSSGTVLFCVNGAEQLASALAQAGAQAGRFHCAPRVASTAVEKQLLWQQTGADAVEMESQVIAEACRQAGVQSATVRVILDPAEEDLPLDFNLLMTPDQRLDGGKLALQLAKSPGKIPALMRLRRQSEAAARRLAEVLERVLNAEGRK